MRHARIVRLLVLTGVGLTTAVGFAAAPPNLPEPIVSRQNLFAIPFRVEKADQPAQEPVEVQLYVSGDRGASWQLYSRTEPARGRFMFRADADGEYWFLVRTLDRSQRLRPEGPAVPELRVIVDTAPPATQWPAERPVEAVTAGTSPPIRNRFVPSDEQTPAPGSGSGDSPDFRASARSVGGENGTVPLANTRIGTVPGSAAAGLPPGERPRMVNSRLFELVYDDDSLGPSGNTRVEIWGTRDGGRTWRSFAATDDCRRPIRISVGEEGTYGFRAVRSAAAAPAQPPKSGDLPEVWIGVDLSKPTARILSAREGSGGEAGSLVISWEAADQTLAARPISLLFSETPGGPWTTIAAGLENTGRYCWPITSRLPQRIYVRLEARDEAGNIGTCETPQPVLLDGFHPSVHVRDVRALGQSSRSEGSRYDVR